MAGSRGRSVFGRLASRSLGGEMDAGGTVDETLRRATSMN
jgi:hypothetical protein